MTAQLPYSLIPYIDLTTLRGDETAQTIKALCATARTSHGRVATVCVYKDKIPDVLKYLKGTFIPVGSVVNFPHGNDPIEKVLQDTQELLRLGVGEVDMVIPYQQYLSGSQLYAKDTVYAVKSCLGTDRILKVILETGILASPHLITQASKDAIDGGADFIKTSTGKVTVNATPEAAQIMLDVIKKSARPVGLKVSGGIHTLAQAMPYWELVQKTMDPNWLNPKHFRIGSSQLLSAILAIEPKD